MKKACRHFSLKRTTLSSCDFMTLLKDFRNIDINTRDSLNFLEQKFFLIINISVQCVERANYYPNQS